MVQTSERHVCDRVFQAMVGLRSRMSLSFADEIATNVPVHWGGDGQAASALLAAHVIGFAPSTLKPSLHVNVALLPWLSRSLLLTPPFAGALALGPVHCVRVVRLKTFVNTLLWALVPSPS